ncbi:glycosyltransferase family 4 protein [Sphingomonas flavalba]|uniref:glycosyltransferase family 4 protein n=1 Tax=Sphingomonas flavalba TaxID=2559804 RepID=UPI0039E17C63
MPALLAATDVMVLPSDSEGLANAWIEALACGTPIVTTDVGGAREVLVDDSAGRIIARPPGATVTAITALLATPPDRRVVRQVAERFTWERNSAAPFDHLSEMVNHR